MISINMLNGLFDPLLESVNNFVTALLHDIYAIIYYFIFGAIGKLCDICQLLFRKFAGIEDMSVNGESGDIVLQFINSEIVQQVFFALLILAVVLLLVTSFIAVIKTEYNADGNNSKKKIIKNVFRAIVNFVTVPVVCLLGLVVGNTLIKTIDQAMNVSGGETTLTGQMFVAGGYNANRVRNYENTGENASGYKEYSMAWYMDESNGGYGSFGIFKDDRNSSAADKIDDAFARRLVIKIDDSSDIKQRTLAYVGNEYAYAAYADVMNNAAINAASNGGVGLPVFFAFPGANATFNYNSDGVKGITFSTSNIINEGDNLVFDIYNIGLVSYYYDISPLVFDYLISGIALIYCAYVFILTCIGLIKRLFMLATLFMISPPICAMYPMDGGSALKKWREAFVGEALSAYAVVIVMNAFFLLLPLFLQIQILTPGINDIVIAGGAAVINSIVRVLIIIAALTFFKKATETIAKIVGAGNAFGDGADNLGKVKEGIGKVAGGGAMVAGAVSGVGKFVGKMMKSGSSEDNNSMNKKDIDVKAENDALDQLNQNGAGADGTNGDEGSTGEGGKLTSSTTIGDANKMNKEAPKVEPLPESKDEKKAREAYEKAVAEDKKLSVKENLQKPLAYGIDFIKQADNIANNKWGKDHDIASSFKIGAGGGKKMSPINEAQKKREENIKELKAKWDDEKDKTKEAHEAEEERKQREALWEQKRKDLAHFQQEQAELSKYVYDMRYDKGKITRKINNINKQYAMANEQQKAEYDRQLEELKKKAEDLAEDKKRKTAELEQLTAKVKQLQQETEQMPQ